MNNNFCQEPVFCQPTDSVSNLFLDER